jgi:gliding motility-associated-like protein
LRDLIEFDLSTIPIGSVITSAKISLYAWTSTTTGNGQHSVANGSNSAWVRRITSPWGENTVTWNTAPSTTTANQVIMPMSTSSTQDYLNINVTNMTQDMVNNPSGSFGYYFQLQTETYYRKLNFCSSDWTVASKHPKIEIIYTPPLTSVYYNPINLGNDTSICASDTINYDFSHLNGTFLWQNGSTDSIFSITDSGTYYVRYITCSNIYYDTIVVSKVNINLGADTSLCLGDSLVLNAGVSGAFYLWNNGGILQSIKVKTQGVYWVKVSKKGCESRDTIKVAFNTKPIVNFGKDTILCLGNSLSLNVLNPGATYLWSDSTTNSTLNILQSGIYWVKANLKGCIGRDTIEVNYDSMINSLLGQDTLMCEEEVIILSSVPYSDFSWFDNSNSTTKLINSPGTYWIRVTNTCGVFLDTILISSKDCSCNIYTPNSFTPNGDNINDLFFPVFDCEPERYNFSIFNRWGELIFESDNVYSSWEGTFEGEKVPIGTYEYKIIYKLDNTVKSIMGHVNVLR